VGVARIKSRIKSEGMLRRKMLSRLRPTTVRPPFAYIAFQIPFAKPERAN
jgi:hypothetical protein